MTVEKHKEIGEKLKLIKKLQEEVYDEVTIAFGKTSQAALFSRKLNSKIGNLFNELDHQLARSTIREEWDKKEYSKIYY